MKKLFIIPLIAVGLAAQNFEQFLESALVKSPYLQEDSLSINQVHQTTEILSRYKNPTLSMEASSFSPDSTQRAVGYRVGLSQPLRVWGVDEKQKALGSAQKEEISYFVKHKRANFVAELSLLFLEYKSFYKRERLAEEELAISLKISTISKERFESGSVAKVNFIQADLDSKRAKNSLDKMRLKRRSSYFKLLAYSGIFEEVEIEAEHNFTLSLQRDSEESLEVSYKKSQVKSSQALESLSAKELEWIELYGEFEKEPDQSIARVGVNIPLYVFNTKSQERKIAQLETQKANLRVQNSINTTQMKLKELTNSLEDLKSLSESTQTLFLSQKELLAMYEDAYRVARVNLVELLMIKNQMIETKTEAIAIAKEYESKIIEHNLLVGEYNEK